jgi:hypothetical protein
MEIVEIKSERVVKEHSRVIQDNEAKEERE